jgi:DNA-binding CsgD family transcriptional regulator
MAWGNECHGHTVVMTRIRTGAAKGRPGEKRGGEGDAAVRLNLTAREIDVLRLLSRGYTYIEIGRQLGISVHTVTSHIKKSYRKLGVHSAAAAVTRAADLHLL